MFVDDYCGELEPQHRIESFDLSALREPIPGGAGIGSDQVSEDLDGVGFQKSA